MRINLKKIIDFRQKLHKHPEPSGKEFYTTKLVKEFVSHFKPDEIIDDIFAEGIGFMAIFDSGKAGETLVFRAELDALPIDESNSNLPYRSVNKGFAHKCGHDGHMAILTALAEAISYDRPKKGKTVLLFQPAEETLEGARTIMDNPKFKNLKPDIIVGFHNLPFYPENAIIIKEENITAATNGMTVTFTGEPTHAAFPEKGISPVPALVELFNFATNIETAQSFKDQILISPTYLNAGYPNFGIMPEKGKIMLTLRAFDYKDLDTLIGMIQDFTKKIAKKYSLSFDITYTDDAPPVYNDKKLTIEIINIAEKLNLPLILLDKPFRWAEDFGYYTLKYKGVFFGFGTGKNTELHTQNYDFPDNIIYKATEVLFNFYKNHQNQ